MFPNFPKRPLSTWACFNGGELLSGPTCQELSTPPPPPPSQSHPQSACLDSVEGEMDLDEPRWIRPLSSQSPWGHGRGEVHPLPAPASPCQPLQPLQRRQTQGHPSPADGAESGNGFQPEGLGLLATEARGLPGRADSGCKHFLPAGVKRGSCPQCRCLRFQVAVEESGGELEDAPSLAGHAVQAPAPGSAAPHVGPAALLGKAALVISSILQETMFM